MTWMHHTFIRKHMLSVPVEPEVYFGVKLTFRIVSVLNCTIIGLMIVNCSLMHTGGSWLAGVDGNTFPPLLRLNTHRLPSTEGLFSVGHTYGIL